MLTIKHTTEVSLNAEDFFDFLKRNNAFEAYKCNIANNYRRLDLISSLNELFNDFSRVKYWIAGAFHWYSTAQGFEYWNKLEIEWCEYFKNCDRINLTPISEETLKKYFIRKPVIGKWYKVTDNSFNRSADNDPNCVWTTSALSLGWKDLVDKAYLILEEPCYVTIDLSTMGIFNNACRNLHYEMVKVWVPEHNCAQWVLFNSKNVCDTK